VTRGSSRSASRTSSRRRRRDHRRARPDRRHRLAAADGADWTATSSTCARWCRGIASECASRSSDRAAWCSSRRARTPAAGARHRSAHRRRVLPCTARAGRALHLPDVPVPYPATWSSDTCRRRRRARRHRRADRRRQTTPPVVGEGGVRVMSDSPGNAESSARLWTAPRALRPRAAARPDARDPALRGPHQGAVRTRADPRHHAHVPGAGSGLDRLALARGRPITCAARTAVTATHWHSG
jgi:hypothetical protein